MRGVRKTFGATVALDGVDFTVHAGEVHALVGENGAGKSTLMKVLAGALSADSGTMELDGHPYQPPHPQAARRAGVAMIYQELSLVPHLTVAENILLGMEPTRWGLLRWGEIRQRAADALAQLGHADIGTNTRVNRLSTGQQQLVEIARAVAIGCRVLVLDEPTSSLSREDAGHLFGLMARLKGQGQAIVYISHFIEEVKQVADRFTVLRDGRTVGGGAIAGTSSQQIVALMIGRHLEDLYVRRRAGGRLGESAESTACADTQCRPTTALEFHNLAGRIKPSSASLTLHRGEVLGIAGLVGAGRTELLRALFGLDPVKHGTVRIDESVGPASPHRRWAQGVGLLSEDRKNEGLAMPLSVADNLTLSKTPWFVRPSGEQAATRHWVNRLSIRCRDPRQRVGDLSGGNQQKVALARLLHHDVELFLLDEPTRGIDVGSKAQIYRLIDDLAASGKAVLIVSSYLPELLGVCDRIAVMCRGRLGEARPVTEWDEHTLMQEATGSA